nr:hypothetical protein [Tanacetum cinerariifolium]
EVGPTTSTAGNDSILIEDPLRPVEPWPTYQTTPFNTTTSTRPPSPSRQTSFQEYISEGGGSYVSPPKSNEAPPTTAATTAGGAEDSVALTDLSLKLDRCINRVTTLENELGVTKKVLGDTIPAGDGIPADAQTIPASRLSAQRQRELDAAQIIYTEADWLELMAKIATNSALSKQLLGDDVNEDNMNERMGMLLMRKRRELAEQSRVKPMNKIQQRDFMQDFVNN